MLVSVPTLVLSSDMLTIKMPDLLEFKIKIFTHEVNVVATSAFIDDNGALLIHVQRVRPVRDRLLLVFFVICII